MEVKLLTCCHRESERGDDLLVTVKAGAALSDDAVVCDHADDDGENISLLNKEYNELSVAYWAWKNYEAIGSPDYVGLMHYRRYFYLDARLKDAVLRTSCPAELFREKALLDKERISLLLSHADFLCPRPARRRSVRAHYALTHDGRDLDLLEEVIADIAPEYLSVAREYFEGKECFFFNMFVFPREIFFRYAAFLFPVLEEYRKRKGGEGRLFVSERLTGVFLSALMKEGLKPTYLPVLYRDGNGETRLRAFLTEWKAADTLKGKLLSFRKILSFRRRERRRV